MMDRLKGKRALVTGAGAGIGRASAIAMAREGAQVIATDRDAGALATLADAGIVTRVLDVRDAGAIADTVTAVGAINVLFNCAGFVAAGTILDCDDDQWDFSVSLNMTAMHRMIRAFLPGMLDHGGGSIINVASAVGAFMAAPNRYVYGATKAAVIGLTKAVAADFVGQGIRCNVICPGTVDTPSLADRIAAFDDPAAARRDFVARQPMGRLGTAQEVAQLAVYLASDEAAFTTGAVHVIDGGWSN